MTELPCLEKSKALALRQATRAAGRKLLAALKEQGLGNRKIAKARDLVEEAITLATEEAN